VVRSQPDPKRSGVRNNQLRNFEHHAQTMPHRTFVR
jgi:hypothetical protein